MITRAHDYKSKGYIFSASSHQTMSHAKNGPHAQSYAVTAWSTTPILVGGRKPDQITSP
jgi:hypothetical protein